MAEERYDPFSNAVVFGPDGQRESLSAAAEPSAVSVAEPAAPVEPQDPVTEPEEHPDGTEPIAADEVGTEAPTDEEQTEEAADAQQRRRRDPSVRFADLARQRNEAQMAQAQAEGRAAALQAELDFYRQQALQPRPPEPAPVPQDGLQRTPQGRPLRPQEESYPTTQDYHQALLTYEDALGQWHAQQAIAQYEQQRSEREATTKLLERYPDFYQVVQQSRIPVNEHIGAAINASPDKPALLYYLATHPAEAQALGPVMGAHAFRAIAALEVRLNAEGTAAPPTTTGPGEPPTPPPPAPPPPIAPTRATGARTPRGYDDVSTLEFFDMRNKEEQARRR